MISVIIPAVDEAGHLPATLAAVQREAEAAETIVVDGGSADETVRVAAAAGARVMVAPVRSRAAQMNLGAAAAAGDVLLFLHADTILPTGWVQAIHAAIGGDPRVVGGAFRRRYVPGSWFLRATCALADMRGRMAGWFLGDQAMFVRRTAFERLGGFARLRACEDLDLSRKLARVGRLVLLHDTVLTADRRFHRRGAVRQTLNDVVTTWRFWRAPDSFLEDAPESVQR